LRRNEKDGEEKENPLKLCTFLGATGEVVFVAAVPLFLVVLVAGGTAGFFSGRVVAPAVLLPAAFVVDVALVVGLTLVLAVAGLAAAGTTASLLLLLAFGLGGAGFTTAVCLLA